VLNSVVAAIRSLLTSTSNQPGSNFRISVLYKAIQDVTGVDYANIDRLRASLEYVESIDTGDGVTSQYTYTIQGPLNAYNNPVIEESVTITDGTQIITDDGSGNLIGDVSAAGNNTINYTTGALDFTFAVAPDLGDAISVTCRNIVDVQRGEVESTATGAQRIQGKTSYAPIVPGQFAISDGSQTVTDDGSGNLQGDVDATGNNSINYESGAYDFTFALNPTVGNNISSTYRQYLDSVSEDVLVEDSQLAAEGSIDVSSL
jgi:hypothetical protein